SYAPPPKPPRRPMFPSPRTRASRHIHQFTFQILRAVTIILAFYVFIEAGAWTLRWIRNWRHPPPPSAPPSLTLPGSKLPARDGAIVMMDTDRISVKPAAPLADEHIIDALT